MVEGDTLMVTHIDRPPQGLTYTRHHAPAADQDKLVEPVSVDAGINHQPASPDLRVESRPLLSTWLPLLPARR